MSDVMASSSLGSGMSDDYEHQTRSRPEPSWTSRSKTIPPVGKITNLVCLNQRTRKLSRSLILYMHGPRSVIVRNSRSAGHVDHGQPRLHSISVRRQYSFELSAGSAAYEVVDTRNLHSLAGYTLAVSHGYDLLSHDISGSAAAATLTLPVNTTAGTNSRVACRRRYIGMND